MIKKSVIFCTLILSFSVFALAHNERVVVKHASDDGDYYLQFTGEKTTRLVTSSSLATVFIRTDKCYLLKKIDGQPWYLNIGEGGKFILSEKPFCWSFGRAYDDVLDDIRLKRGGRDSFPMLLDAVWMFLAIYEIEPVGLLSCDGFNEHYGREGETDWVAKNDREGCEVMVNLR